MIKTRALMSSLSNSSWGLGWATKFIEKNLVPTRQAIQEGPAQKKEELVGELSLLLKKDFSSFNKEQIELVCSTFGAIAKYKIENSSALTETEKRKVCIPVCHPVVSRVALKIIEEIQSPDHIFNQGDYPSSAKQTSILAHLESGGDSSVFRGTTESQDEGITHQSSPRVTFSPIFQWGISIPSLVQLFNDHKANESKSSRLREDLGLNSGQQFPEVFNSEQELTVVRPIPPENVKKIGTIGFPLQPKDISNPNFSEKTAKKLSPEISRNHLEKLKKKGCLASGTILNKKSK